MQDNELDFDDDHFPSNTEAQWISLSDLMTGMMMMFLLIAITFMLKVQADASKVRDYYVNASANEGSTSTNAQPDVAAAQAVAVNAQAANARADSVEAVAQTAAATTDANAATTAHIDANATNTAVDAKSTSARQVLVVYDQIRRDLYNELVASFQSQLTAWGAEITPDLTVRFNEPEVLFSIGKDELQPKFQKILAEFFPRYVQIITSEKYKSIIQEVRIEGHTSSIWKGAATTEDAYFNNMELSQSRTRSTLRYVLGLPDVHNDTDWLRSHVTANGLSSSHLIFNSDGTENMPQSQRIEFRIRTDAESRIATVLESQK